jgi:hypothetical protein
VDSIDFENRAMEISYGFVPKGSSNNENIITEPMSCSVNAKEAFVHSGMEGDYVVYKIDSGLASANNQVINIELFDATCDELAGCPRVTAYKEYPLNLDINPHADLGVGAIAELTFAAGGIDYCKDNGFCVTTGYSNIDACDYYADDSNQWFISETKNILFHSIYEGNCANITVGGTCWGLGPPRLVLFLYVM